MAGDRTANCPRCGNALPTSKMAPLDGRRPVRFCWRLFLAGMLLPSFVTLLSAAAMRLWFLPKAINEGFSPIVAILTSGIGGIVCGALLGFYAGGTVGARVGISIVMSAIMIVVCLVLSFFGCGIGGYQMRLN